MKILSILIVPNTCARGSSVSSAGRFFFHFVSPSLFYYYRIGDYRFPVLLSFRSGFSPEKKRIQRGKTKKLYSCGRSICIYTERCYIHHAIKYINILYTKLTDLAHVVMYIGVIVPGGVRCFTFIYARGGG